MCYTRLAENTGRKNCAKKSLSAHHRTSLSGYIFATKAHIDNRKNLLNGNICSTCPHNMVNFGSLTAEIGWPVWSTPENFNRFRVLASLLHRRRSTKVSQDVWLSPALVHYIYILGGCCPLTEFCQVQNSLRPSLLGRGAGSPSNTVSWVDAYLCTKWHLDPSSRLATIHMGCGLCGRRQSLLP